MNISGSKILKAGAFVVALVALGACSTQKSSVSTGGTSGGYYKIGQPYQIKGQWYYPKEDFSYDETGVASWYGADFHQKKTANGEIFNKDELTAAHATLPMPSLARVTNMENGKSLVVRINDRGPFSGARIIDVTERAAQLLGFERQGTAKVRVQVLADESKAIADAMRRYGSPTPEPYQVASADVSSVPAASTGSVTSEPLAPLPGQDIASEQPLAPLPKTHAEARAMMKTIQPVPEVRQLPVSAQQDLYVQVGAFIKISNATKLEQKLASFGHVRVANVDVKGIQFYRVQVGPIKDVASADVMLGKIVKAGHREARIVVD